MKWNTRSKVRLWMIGVAFGGMNSILSYAEAPLANASSKFSEGPGTATSASLVVFFDEQTDFIHRTSDFDLTDPCQISSFRMALQEQISRARTESQAIKAAQKNSQASPLFSNHAGTPELATMEKMASILNEAGGLEHASGAELQNRIHLLVELGWAVSSTFRVPVPSRDEIPKIAWEVIFGGSLVSPPVCQGARGNEVISDEAGLTSSFWSLSETLSEQDAYYGFGRSSLPNLKNEICEFQVPKGASDSYGTHAKITANCGSYHSVKIKFGKFHSEPFGSRMFSLLGYHTYPNDHVDFVRMKFTPEIFENFNDRKDALIQIIPHLIEEHSQKQWDPFDFLDEVEMKDGTVYGRREGLGHSLEDLKKILFITNRPVHRVPPALLPGNLTAVKDQIANLVFGDAEISMTKSEDDHSESVGAWDWTAAGHADLPELRMAGIFLAWLNAFDIRWDNNDLRLSKGGEPFTLTHVIKDTGGVLGDYRSMKSILGSREKIARITSEDADDFQWSFTHAVPFTDGLPETVPLDDDFHTIQYAGAIAKGNVQDALKMAALIAQVTQTQLKAALIGSGFPSAKVRMFYNKLANRRNLLMQHLGLTSIPLLPLEDLEKDFSYDPIGKLAPGTPESVTLNGVTYFADDNDGTEENAFQWVVIRGQVKLRDEVISSSR